MKGKQLNQATSLDQFSHRFQREAEFRDLVRQDARAALGAAGIGVPEGIRVDYAHDPASALSLALDHSGGHAGVRALDDDQLLGVVGGVGPAANPSEVRKFLDLLDLGKA